MTSRTFPPGGEPVVAPSILSADFGCLKDQLAAVERGGAGMIHVDVMDGHFVPNITMGVPIVRSLASATRLPLDVHLMITDPARYAGEFVSAGASLVSFHVEAASPCGEVIREIRSAGARAGIAVNPTTPLAALDGVLDQIDYVLLMSVQPGFGGQKFIPATFEKLAALREILGSGKGGVPIEVDGGVGEENAGRLVAAGARFIVAGSAIFAGGDPEETTRRLRARLREEASR